MMRYIFSLLYILLFVAIAQSNTNDYEVKLKKTVDLIFNFNFSEAENSLSLIAQQNKNDTRPLLYLSNVYVWKFIGDREKSDFEKFKRLSDETIQKSEEILKSNNKDRWAYYSLISIYGYRALMFFMNRNFIDGLWAARKSINYSEELLKIDPNFYDGYLWRGLFYFSLHQVPSYLRGFLSIVGLSGDIKQGLKDIQLVASRGNFAKVEATYFLSQFYSSSLNDNQRAYELLKELALKYPGNELFNYSTAIELMKLHRLEEAKVYLQKIISEKSVEILSLKNMSYFLLGDCHFYRNDFTNAISNYNLFLNRYEQNQYKPTAYFRLGISYYLLQNKEKARDSFEKVKTIKSKVNEDVFHQRYAEKILSSNFNEALIRIFVAWNLIRSGQFNSAINRLNELEKSNQNNDERIVLSYLKGLAYYKLNDSVNARKFLIEALKIETKDELWAKAFSYLYLARVEFDAKNYRASENYISQILQLKEFDYENSVKSQAKNLLERIKSNY